MKIVRLTAYIITVCSIMMSASRCTEPEVRTVMYSPERVGLYAHQYRMNRVARTKRRYWGYVAATGLIVGGYMVYQKLFRSGGSAVATVPLAEPVKTSFSIMSAVRYLGRLGQDMLLFLLQHTCVELCAIPLANMFVRPIENSIRDESIIGRSGCWFLDEQIADKRLPHAVVGHDLYDLVKLLMRIEACGKQIADMVHMNDIYKRRRVINEESLTLTDISEQLQGAIDALDQVLSGSERELLYIHHTVGLRLMSGIQVLYETILAQIHASPEEWIGIVTGALTIWNASYKIAVRPLMHLSCYHVRPWPLLEGTINCARALFVRTMIMN